MSEKPRDEQVSPESSENAAAAAGGPGTSNGSSDAGASGPAEDRAAGDAAQGAEEIEVEVEVDAPDTRVAELEARLAEVEKDKQDNWDRLLRATADLDNLRKRSKRELEDARLDARTRVLKEMLPVVDNLERAVQHAIDKGHGEDAEASAVIEGVKLVLRQFGQAFERLDVQPVEAEGKPFDPNVHEAISQEVTDAQPPGTVVQVFQKGYTIGPRLLRPALVVVAKAPPQEHAGPNGSDPGAAGDAAPDEQTGSSEA